MNFWRTGLMTIIFLFFLLIAYYAYIPKKPDMILLEGKTMGTFWRVNIHNAKNFKMEQLRIKIQAQLDSDDQLLSIWKNDSSLMRFNLSRSTLPWPISEAMADIITESLRVGYKTNGAMDITIGPLINLWGFGPDSKPITIPTKIAIDDAIARTGLHHLTVINRYGQQYMKKDIPNLFIDLSTVGEGYAADHLAAMMMQEGITQYLISVGGALVSSGKNFNNRSWRVAIQKPIDEQNVVHAIVNVNGCGISTSGSYRNYYKLNGKHISHVIDPKTGQPIEHNLVSVTVIAPTALEADAWDTGLMVLGVEKAKEVINKQRLAAYMIIKEGDNFKSWISPQFRNYLVNTQNRN